MPLGGWSDTEPRYHQEQVFKILGLAWAGESAEDLQDLAQAVLDQQRDDGGWSQLSGMQSDAWATSQSLVALRIAGNLATSDSAYQRGLEYLLRTQFDDGSWFVRGRSFPFQSPFDSGFPFGRDQWVSAPATAWAVMAMTLALEPLSADQHRAATLANQLQAEQAANTSVNFVRDIKPILERSCVGCHSGDEPQSGNRVTDRESLLRGGESGEAAVVAGDSSSSHLLTLVSRSG